MQLAEGVKAEQKKKTKSPGSQGSVRHIAHVGMERGLKVVVVLVVGVATLVSSLIRLKFLG